MIRTLKFIGALLLLGFLVFSFAFLVAWFLGNDTGAGQTMPASQNTAHNNI